MNDNTALLLLALFGIAGGCVMVGLGITDKNVHLFPLITGVCSGGMLIIKD